MNMLAWFGKYFKKECKSDEQFKEYLQSERLSEQVQLIIKFLIDRGQDLTTLLTNTQHSTLAIVEGRLKQPSELDVLRMQLIFSLSADTDALITLKENYKEAYFCLISCGGSIGFRAAALEVSKGSDAVLENLSYKNVAIVSMLAGQIISQSNAGSNKGLETKQLIIEQWQKFTGDKATASAFIKKLFCYDSQGEPAYFKDVLTGEKLDESLIASERTVRQYVNEYKKQK